MEMEDLPDLEDMYNPDGHPGHMRAQMGDLAYQQMVQSNRAIAEAQAASILAHARRGLSMAGMFSAVMFAVLVATIIGAGFGVKFLLGL